MRTGSLFSGYEGLGLAVNPFFDAETAWVSDIDPGACKILAHHYPDVPNLGDIARIDWANVEPVDILTGGFPCQDLSHAGKRAGMHDGTRSGLWSHMADAIEQLRPRYVVAENVRGILSASATSDLEPCPWCLGGSADGEPALRALGCVLGDLAERGYDTQWHGLRAADVGAPHGRFRVFLFARDTNRREQSAVGSIRGGATAESGRVGEVVADSGRHAGRAGRVTAPGQTDGWGAHGQLAGRGRASVADANTERHGGGQDDRVVGRVDGQVEGEARQRQRAREQSGDRGREAPAHTWCVGRDPAGSDDGAALRTRAEEEGREPEAGRIATWPSGSSQVDWGAYELAIRRWERILGREAPAPTETSSRGSQRLSPAFVEWLMGLPAGHVTEVPNLSRNEQLKALGNGCVPQQVLLALHLMEAGHEDLSAMRDAV